MLGSGGGGGVASAELAAGDDRHERVTKIAASAPMTRNASSAPAAANRYAAGGLPSVVAAGARGGGSAFAARETMVGAMRALGIAVDGTSIAA